MWIGVVSILPELITSALQGGVVGRAIQSGQLKVDTFNPRDFTEDPHRTVDDRPFGGGPGMLMLAQPLSECVGAALQNAPGDETLTIGLSPQGERLDQRLVRDLASQEGLLFVAGRFEGMDERFIDAHIDRELSIGDYVLSGGELPALVVIDAIARLIPGTLGNADSAQNDSFDDNLLEGPQFTRPREWHTQTVPDVLVSGDHSAVARWQREQALHRTWERRPDLLLHHRFTAQDRHWLVDHCTTLPRQRKEDE